MDYGNWIFKYCIMFPLILATMVIHAYGGWFAVFIEALIGVALLSCVLAICYVQAKRGENSQTMCEDDGMNLDA